LELQVVFDGRFNLRFEGLEFHLKMRADLVGVGELQGRGWYARHQVPGLEAVHGVGSLAALVHVQRMQIDVLVVGDALALKHVRCGRALVGPLLATRSKSRNGPTGTRLPGCRSWTSDTCTFSCCAGGPLMWKSVVPAKDLSSVC